MACGRRRNDCQNQSSIVVYLERRRRRGREWPRRRFGGVNGIPSRRGRWGREARVTARSFGGNEDHVSETRRRGRQLGWLWCVGEMWCQLLLGGFAFFFFWVTEKKRLIIVISWRLYLDGWAELVTCFFVNVPHQRSTRGQSGCSAALPKRRTSHLRDSIPLLFLFFFNTQVYPYESST